MVWRASDPQGNESGKMLWELVPFTRGLGYDIGCGPHKAFPHFIGIDSNKDEKLFGIKATTADIIVPDACVLPMLASAHADFVFSSHTLEHIKEHKVALREWWRVIKPGGHLCLYLPHKSFYPNIGTEGANPDHKHDFMPQDIIDAMKEVGGWDLLVNEDRNEGMEYSFFQVYKKYADAKVHRYSCREPKPAKRCAVIRYGAWGDVIQMSSILPALKAEGYHITLYTVPRAWEAVKHDPLIDAVILQDQDQVPNHALGHFIEHLRGKYEKLINLSESVEGAYLALPDRAPFHWSHEARHAYMNGNYLELTHAIAGVPYEKPLMRFVASEEEKKWARAERQKMGDKVILWVLRGSSQHKVWSGGEDKTSGATGFDAVLARIMLTWPNIRIVTVGDESCRDIIEKPWGNERRIVRRSAVWSIRQTMAFAQFADLVIGPETGVLSAVAMEPMRKIVFLSHSSVENLTRDWINTVSLHARNTPCWPCHRMIYTWEHCNQDGATGIAKCQADISPAEVWDAICDTLAEQEAA